MTDKELVKKMIVEIMRIGTSKQEAPRFNECDFLKNSRTVIQVLENYLFSLLFEELSAKDT